MQEGTESPYIQNAYKMQHTECWLKMVFVFFPPHHYTFCFTGNCFYTYTVFAF